MFLISPILFAAETGTVAASCVEFPAQQALRSWRRLVWMPGVLLLMKAGWLAFKEI
jgi:hypothetical protein